MELRSDTLLQGGKYKIIEKIGQGGFGIAYRAYHEGLQNEVCIKEFFYSDLCERANNLSDVTIISASPEKIKLVDSFKMKFIKEAQRLAKFQHPSIVKVLDNFEENNTAYFVMEYLDGGSLEDLIRMNEVLTEEKTRQFILPVIEAMELVHKSELLHLDIKPANIMLRKNQSPILIDFGISKYTELAARVTTTAPIGISKGYAPLEQYGGNIADFSKATDVYSICATIYRMVTGIIPPEPMQIINSGIKQPRDINSQLSMNFNAAIIKGLATKPTERHQSMSQLKSALGESKKVAQTIIETVELAPTTADAYFKRAEIKRNNQRYKEAIEDYDEAIKKSSKNENFYFYRALCNQELNKLNDAIKDYTKVIELNSENDAAYNNRGTCYSKSDKKDIAANDFYRAYEIEKKDSYYDNLLSALRHKPNIDILNKYISNNWPKQDKFYMIRAILNLSLNNTALANDDILKANSLGSWKAKSIIKLWTSPSKVLVQIFLLILNAVFIIGVLNFIISTDINDFKIFLSSHNVTNDFPNLIFLEISFGSGFLSFMISANKNNNREKGLAFAPDWMWIITNMNYSIGLSFIYGLLLVVNFVLLNLVFNDHTIWNKDMLVPFVFIIISQILCLIFVVYGFKQIKRLWNKDMDILDLLKDLIYYNGL